MDPNPVVCAIFSLTLFVFVGFAQTLWLRSATSQRFATPVDFGLTWRNCRVFGDNKTFRGFVVMLPAGAVTFLLGGLLVQQLDPAGPVRSAVWDLTSMQWATLGLLASLGFLLGELPNSFLKRRLGIAPGGAPDGKWLRRTFFVVDQLDSGFGMMITMSLLVPTGVLFWATFFLVGALLHWLFAWMLFAIGLKARPA